MCSYHVIAKHLEDIYCNFMKTTAASSNSCVISPISDTLQTHKFTKRNPDLHALTNKIMVKVDKQAAGFDEGRPTVADLYGDNPFAQAAKQHWLKEKPSKFRPDALKTEFYDVLEKDGFRFRSLLILENLQFLEKFVVLFAAWGNSCWRLRYG